MAGFRFSDGAGIPNKRDFITSSIITVTHGLGYHPLVTIVIDGVEAYGKITHNNLLTFTVTFETVESGVIYYR